jgi:Tol biopolymer transport system component
VPLAEVEVAILTLYVANADGSAIRPLTPPTKSLDWLDWSPDGTRVAYMAQGALWVVDVAGGTPQRLRAAEPAHFPTWLPPDGREIVFRRETESPGIFAIAPDGTAQPRPLSQTIANNRFDFQSIAASPDGSSISFTRWSPGGLPRVFAIDVPTGKEIAFPMEGGIGQQGSAVYSPDGRLVAYARVFATGYQVVVANADGTGNERPIGPRKPGPPEGSSWAFTPMGPGWPFGMGRTMMERPSSCRSMDRPAPRLVPGGSSSSTSNAWHPEPRSVGRVNRPGLTLNGGPRAGAMPRPDGDA